MIKPREMLNECTGFQWDGGNDAKNWDKHDVTCGECEQVFFNRPLIIKHDSEHSITEPRYFALGKTDANRLMFVAFTMRGSLIRVISAREMTIREQERYLS